MRTDTYIGTDAAVPVLRRRFRERPDGVRLPGGPAILIAALVLSIAFLASARTGNLIAGSIGLAVGVVLYQLRQPPRRESVVVPP